MNSRELRIGNLILGVSDRVETVTEIRGEHWIKSYPGLLKEANFDVEAKDCNAIPLTEEWLLKAGFLPANLRPESDTNWSIDYDLENVYFGRLLKVYKNQDEYIGLCDDGFYYSAYEGIASDESGCLFMYGVPLQFVHSLQNVWPFITGQELQLTT